MPPIEQENSGILRKMPPAKLHALLGEITGLMLASKLHRQYQVRDIADIVLPAVNLNQFRIYRDAKRRPIGLVTWGLFSEAVEKKYLAGQMVLNEQELRSGDRLYFIDFIAPYGHAKKIIRDLRDNVTFPANHAHSRRFVEPGKERPRVYRFRSGKYKEAYN